MKKDSTYYYLVIWLSVGNFKLFKRLLFLMNQGTKTNWLEGLNSSQVRIFDRAQ